MPRAKTTKKAAHPRGGKRTTFKRSPDETVIDSRNRKPKVKVRYKAKVGTAEHKENERARWKDKAAASRSGAKKARPVFAEELSLLEWKIAKEWVLGNHHTKLDVARAVGIGKGEPGKETQAQKSNMIDAIDRALAKEPVQAACRQLEADWAAEAVATKQFILRKYADAIMELYENGNHKELARYLKDLSHLLGFIGFSPIRAAQQNPPENFGNSDHQVDSEFMHLMKAMEQAAVLKEAGAIA